ncbi:MAG: tRNA uridine-5-carboxymethylaminomethyl(34) synthesis GTPase MnmE [Proteobacteria bacterium]|nr:tRNA uridine-5-carboxymethylaminomethyl(34) synthesis GTPase MnmE [Pseudomonadota bacterium]
MEKDDTICAISTPVGEGGIGVVRMSGQFAHPILKKIFKPNQKNSFYQPRTLYLGHITNPDNNNIVDEVFVVFMHAPNTFTKEDIAEVYSHGGYATLKSILAIMIAQGARLAEPGEFTKRAFLNGRIDLLQAESVLDIIQSETDEELKNAIDQLEGKLSRKVNVLKGDIKEALIEIDAFIEFPEEDVEIDKNGILLRLRKTKQEIETLVNSYYEGKAIKHGLEVLIVGKPNVGKSSLLNALLLKEKAIVTPIPGTTRDLIEDTFHIKGIKVKIIDTAGLRKPRDAVEREGVERVNQKIPKTDLIIWVLDGSETYTSEDEDILTKIKGMPVVPVINKIDLTQRLEKTILKSGNLQWIEISALKDIGFEELKDEIYVRLMKKGFKRGDVLITNMRHRDALEKTAEAISRAITCIIEQEPLEFTAFELQESLLRLGEITGETCPDEILQGIFTRFCIGK